ncbi:hypothetical protein ACLOJK_014337 [Asimina triloba]
MDGKFKIFKSAMLALNYLDKHMGWTLVQALLAFSHLRTRGESLNADVTVQPLQLVSGRVQKRQNEMNDLDRLMRCRPPPTNQSKHMIHEDGLGDAKGDY